MSERRIIENLPTPTLDALLEHASRLKHDLGKYVRFQGRWLPADAAPEAQREALEADLLHTRRGPDGSVDASTVWQEFSGALLGEAPLGGELVDLSRDPDVAAIVQGMRELEGVIAALRSETLDETGLIVGERASDAVAEAIRRLVSRVRELGRGRMDG